MKTIALDFDGVLHSYTSGWQGATVIPDPPTEGAVEFVERLLEDGWEVVVCSTRAETPTGRACIVMWLQENGFPVEDGGIREVCHGKPPALVYLDDRALRFDGVWPEPAALEVASRPWNKR